MRATILNREQAAPRYFSGVLQEKKRPLSLEELERELEVLRNKLRSLELSHMRIERRARLLTDKLEILRNANVKSTVSIQNYRIAGAKSTLM